MTRLEDMNELFTELSVRCMAAFTQSMEVEVHAERLVAGSGQKSVAIIIIIGAGARQRSEGHLGDVQIQPSESVRSLGVVIDNIRCHSMHMLTLAVNQPFITPGLYVISGLEFNLPLMSLYP